MVCVQGCDKHIKRKEKYNQKNQYYWSINIYSLWYWKFFNAEWLSSFPLYSTRMICPMKMYSWLVVTMSDLFVVLNFYLHFGFVWQIVKCTAQRLKKKEKKKASIWTTCSIVFDENIYLDKTTLITITTDIPFGETFLITSCTINIQNSTGVRSKQLSLCLI